MSWRDTKILIPEIPGEWTQRTISGSTMIWNDSWHKTGLPEVRMKAPQKGLRAERIDGAWYWVCDCTKCLGTESIGGFYLCDEHDKCVECNTPRAALTDTPWGVRNGWCCRPCMDAKKAAAKAEALARAAASGHSEDDCSYIDKILCPHCATEQSADDRYESADGLECDTCGGVFDLEIEYTPSYTTTKAKEPK